MFTNLEQREGESDLYPTVMPAQPEAWTRDLNLALKPLYFIILGYILQIIPICFLYLAGVRALCLVSILVVFGGADKSIISNADCLRDQTAIPF